MRRRVLRIRSKPGIRASVLPGERHQRADEFTADALVSMGSRDTDLVYPELGRLVRMEVFDGRSHTDNQWPVRGQEHDMSRVVEKRRQILRVYRMIEDFGCDVREQIAVVVIQLVKPDGHLVSGHQVASNLIDAGYAGLPHHDLQFALQDIQDGLHAFLAEGTEAPEVGAADGDSIRADR